VRGHREFAFVRRRAAAEPQAATLRTLVEQQVANNSRSASLWDIYADHRRRLTDLVVSSARGSDLVVLGAGNANDLDLAALACRFERIHLADVDAVAVARAVRRQDAATCARLAVHGGRDLSGLLRWLPAWHERPPSLELLARVARSAGAWAAAQVTGSFDVVLSDCLLSQIAWTCFRALGDGPLLMSVLDIALAAHLRTLVALARPGARCLLVTDVVSSETQPLASLLANRRGEALLAHLEEQHGLFSGTSPQLARLMLAQDPELAPQVEDVALLEPWLWRISRSRTVLVYALAFSRRASPLIAPFCDAARPGGWRR
jgi:hypothetical protein